MLVVTNGCYDEQNKIVLRHLQVKIYNSTKLKCLSPYHF